MTEKGDMRTEKPDPEVKPAQRRSFSDAEKRCILDEAYAAHPERFVGGRPTSPQPPKEV